jgi:H+-transporting ATPase
MYLKLSVAGHLTIFLTRTRGPFWSIRPAKILWMAVVGTQIVATLIAVYGVFMTPLGWGWALSVWGYALVWFLFNDRLKLLAYRILDPVKAQPKSDVKADTEPDAKVATRSGSKAKTTPEAQFPPDTKGSAISDLTPQIAARAYELYEHQGRRDGQSVQNWDKAEREIRETRAKAEPKAETKPAAKADSEPETKAQPGPDANSKPEARVQPAPATKGEPEPDAKPPATPEAKPEAKTESPPEAKAPATPKAKAVPPSAVKGEPQPATKTGAKPTDKVEPKPDAQTETKPESSAKSAVEVSPQLATKVHEFYEQLGREDVRAVQEADKAKQKTRKAPPPK